MTPTQVTIRFPADNARQWKLQPAGVPPRIGAIIPLAWDLTPTPAEVIDGGFEVALIATDEAVTAWAWRIREPSGRRRVIAVPAALADTGVVAYADLVDVDPGTMLAAKATRPAEVGAATDLAPAPPASQGPGDMPLWLLDVVADLARRQGAAEALTGTPEGMDPIDATDAGVTAYLDGFRSTTASAPAQD